MNNELKVQCRDGFSDRRNINPLNTEIQIKYFDECTRNRIANLLKRWTDFIESRQVIDSFFTSLLNEVYGEFVNESLAYNFKFNYEKSFNEYIYKPISSYNYSDVLTIVEYIANYTNDIYKNISYYSQMRQPNCVEQLNELFKKEFVGYRMIENEITPICDEIELKEIQNSLDIKFDGCKSHINKALSLISKRENPDFKNSIKESILAVESICKIICKDDNATLGKALNKLESNGIKLHGALKEAFGKLYGYTSDEGGIRHAEGMFESNVTFEDAKYFLVSCCAFVNYLIEKCSELDREEF